MAPEGNTGSEKRAFFFGLFLDGVVVCVGLAGDMASLDLLGGRTVTVSASLSSAMMPDVAG